MTGPQWSNRAPRTKVRLTDFGKAILRNAKLGIRTLVPVRVAVAYPDDTVDVLPQHNTVIRDDDDEQELVHTPIPKCPVAWVSSLAGTCYLKFPLAPGDPGYLLMSDRSLERWLTQGVPVDPGVGWTHNAVDGIFHPQIRPVAEVLPPGNPIGPVLEGPQVFIGSAAVEPMIKATTFTALMDGMIAAAIAASVPTDGGTAAFTAFQTAWNAAKATFLAAKGRVE